MLSALIGDLCNSIIPVPLRYAAQNFNLSSPAGHAGACFWITDKRRMPKDGAKPEVNLRYSKGAYQARLGRF